MNNELFTAEQNLKGVEEPSMTAEESANTCVHDAPASPSKYFFNCFDKCNGCIYLEIIIFVEYVCVLYKKCVGAMKKKLFGTRNG